MARERKLLSLDPEVSAILASKDNASEYVAALVLAAEGKCPVCGAKKPKAGRA